MFHCKQMMFDASSASSCDGSSCVPHEFTQANRCFLNVFSLVCLAIAACRAAYTFARKIFSPHAYMPKSQNKG